MPVFKPAYPAPLPRLTGDDEQDRIGFKLDLQPIIQESLDRVRAAVEAGCTEILRDAYLAGRRDGALAITDMQISGRSPNPEREFDRYVADLIERNRHA